MLHQNESYSAFEDYYLFVLFILTLKRMPLIDVGVCIKCQVIIAPKNKIFI